MYAWVLTYFVVWTGKGFLGVGVFAVAMGVHLFPITCGLKEHYQEVYHRGGAFLLALGSLAGWVCGMTLSIPRPILFNMVAIVAGGVIVNSAIAELTKEKEGRFCSFLTGAAVYTALLLTLLSLRERPLTNVTVEHHSDLDLARRTDAVLRVQ